MRDQPRRPSDAVLAVGLVLWAAQAVFAFFWTLVWIVILGHGSSGHPHGTDVFQAGLLLVLVLACWLVWLARRLWRSGRGRGTASALTLVLVVVALIPPYTVFSIPSRVVTLVVAALVLWLRLTRERGQGPPPLRPRRLPS